MLFTLQNRSKTLAGGLFLSREEAEFWAAQHLNGMGMEPIEILVEPTLHSEVVELLRLREASTREGVTKWN